MSEKEIKVIDRRMFTAEGELRDEYRDQVDPDRPLPPRAPAATETAPTATPSPGSERPGQAPQETPELPADDADGPQFGDLVSLLAQTTAAYIQQARASASPDMMQMARLHVDLLGVLERKTAGNLAPDEAGMLQDVQRQLRLALG